MSSLNVKIVDCSINKGDYIELEIYGLNNNQINHLQYEII